MAPTVSDFDLQLGTRDPRRAQPGSILNLSKPVAQHSLSAARRPASGRTRGITWRQLTLMVLSMVSLVEVAILGARAYAPAQSLKAVNGTLVVESNPAGILVFVNGLEAGVTPARVELKAGSHLVELRGRGVPRVIPIKMTAGALMAHYVEMPAAASTGRLHVSSPARAQVSVDGVPRGIAPLNLSDLAIGPHRITLSSNGTSVEETVQIDSGTTTSLVVPLAVSAAAVSGWIAVRAPFEMQILENGQVIGTTQNDRIAISAGQHTIEVVSSTLGYQTSHLVDVRAGKVAPVNIELPQGTMDLNATPWAEVWIDGQSVGETPIGRLAITIGPHEIVFKHPELGEKRHAAVVTMNGPSRVSVDLRK